MGETVVALIGGGGLLGVVGYLLAAMARDRREHRADLSKADARADAAELRTRAAHQVADEARAARHACEDTCAALRGELAALRAQRDGEHR